MRSTIQDIAREANVSINTVSRALNNKGGVKPETRDRIFAIAEQLDYVPNKLARGLLDERTGTFGVLVTDNANPFFARMIRGIEDCARTNGYNIILCNSDEDPVKEEEALHILKARRTDGILITPVSTAGDFLKSLENMRLPIVLLNRTTDATRLDYVKTDNAHGAKLAVGRLIECGRRRLLYLGGPRNVSSAAERAEGCRRAIEEAGLDPATLTMIDQCLHMDDGYQRMREVLHSERIPDGVFCFSDIIAIGAIRAIREAKLRVPEDIAVIGFDDIEIASYLRIALTTIRQATYEMGWKAVELLLNRLSDRIEDHVPQHVVFTPELILRSSS